MSRKLTLRVASYIFALLILGIVAQAQPATANFVIFNQDGYNIYDLNNNVNTRYVLYTTGTCYYYVDQTTFDTWGLVTPVYYFRTDFTSTLIPIVFGTLRNTRTNRVWDGGYAVASDYAYLYAYAWPSCY
jgi:hypothetical protein